MTKYLTNTTDVDITVSTTFGLTRIYSCIRIKACSNFKYYTVSSIAAFAAQHYKLKFEADYFEYS